MDKLIEWLADQHSLAAATWALVGATLLLALTGVAGIIFAWRQLVNERKQRQVENLEHQLDTWEGQRYRSLRSGLASKRLRGDSLRHLDPSDPPDQAYDILDFFEHLAVLVKHGNLSAFDVWHAFGPWIGAIWSDLRGMVALEQQDSPVTYCDFSWLIKEISAIEKEEAGKFLDYDDDDLEAFYLYEAEVATSIGGGLRSRPKKRQHKTKKRAQSESGPIPQPSTQPLLTPTMADEEPSGVS